MLSSGSVMALVYIYVMHFLVFLPVLIFLAAAFVATLFPRLLARLTNLYYSKIGMKTRVEEEDHDRLSTRIAGAILLVVGCVLAYRWMGFRH
jgi:phosphate/sulfate permease